MTNVVYLHQPAAIVRFLRVSEHRKLDHLLGADRLPYEHFVIDAGRLKEQYDLIKALKQRGFPLTLDTNIAELSAIGRFESSAKNAPWAAQGQVLTEAHLKPGSNEGIIGAIARLAVREGFARVLSPSHFILGPHDPWLKIDLENCIALRKALDVEGGTHIDIDYHLMVPKRVLDDGPDRRHIIAALQDMAISSIWTRVSGFGADGTGAGTRKYISALQDFHSLNKPIIADGIGGHIGRAVVAFGAASGLSYGVATKERFDASSWYTPPKPNGGGGGGSFSLLMPGIDHLLRREDAEAIINAPSGRRLCACFDRRCCPHGFDDTLKDPKGHFLRQRAFRCDELSQIPESMRARHYLDKDLRDDERRAKQLMKLKLGDERLAVRLANNAKRFDRMSEILDNLEQNSATATRSPRFVDSHQENKMKKDRH